MEDIILVGYGGHARSIADCIERKKQYRIVGYTEVSKVNSDYPYLGTDDVLNTYYENGVKNLVICLGYLGRGIERERLYSYVKKIGFELPIIVDPSSIISENVSIGEGSFVGKNAIINSNSSIGKMCIINTMALVEHESIIGDFSHIAVSAVICGQVSVGRGAFVGANATVLQNRQIGDKEIIPAGIVL